MMTLNKITNLVYLVLLVFSTLCFYASSNYFNIVIPIEDYAADMLLANRITNEGYLLVGHYSRWEFNHPGPFWFYYNRFIEILFSNFFSTRWQIWQAGSILINTAFISFSAYYLSKYNFKKFNIFFSCVFSILLIGSIGGNISSIWMPNRLLTPYAAFLISVLHISSGNYLFILPATLLTCILVHGYATMPILTLPIFFICLIVGYYHINRNSIRDYAYTIFMPSVIIILLFISPIIIDFFVSDKPNIYKIYEASKFMRNLPKPTWSEMSEFISELIFKKNFTGWILSTLLVIIYFTYVRTINLERSKVVHFSVLILSVLILTVICYKNTPTPLYPFVASYITILPALVFSQMTYPLFYPDLKFNYCSANSKSNYPFFIKITILSLIVCSFIFPIKPVDKIEKNLEISQIAEKISDLSEGTNVRIDYTDHFQWSKIAGLLLELDRKHVHACAAWPQMAFLYTEKYTCKDDEYPNFVIKSSEDCVNSCIFKSGNLVLEKFSHTSISPDQLIKFNNPGVRFIHWADPETSFRWSLNGVSKILFVILSNKEKFSGNLELSFELLGNQYLEIILNDVIVYSNLLANDTNNLSIKFQPSILKQDKNVLEFRLPNSHSPGNNDQRVLGLALKSFIFR